MGRDGVLRQLVMLTARQALGRRRVILAALASCAPILVAVTYRMAGGQEHQTWLAGLLDGLVITTLLPLVALVFGTSVVGGEIDDGTIVYLLVRPVARWLIVLAKLAVAVAATAASAPRPTDVARSRCHGRGDGCVGSSAAATPRTYWWTLRRRVPVKSPATTPSQMYT